MRATFIAVGLGLVFSSLVMGWPSRVFAYTTSFGQTWDSAPDAWLRGNDADTSHFGWDNFESNGHPFLSGGRILDDSVPDIGGVTTALGTRIYQGVNGVVDPSPTSWGHRSGSGNYYSGPFTGADDSIVATAPASGVGGFTTVLVQMIGTLQPSAGVSVEMDQSLNTWTLQKSLFNLNATGSGQYWVEFTAPGNDLPFRVVLTSTEASIALDGIQVDTFWSPNGPVVNARSAIPEPTSLVLLATGLSSLARRRRRTG